MEKNLKAIKVKQWLKEWDKYDFSKKNHKDKPEPHFYIFSLSAPQLKALSGIFRRTTQDKIAGHSENIQRRHDEERSLEINEYYKYGHPYAELSDAKKKSGLYEDVKRPGWLPTAIVVNILKGEDKRKNKFSVAKKDLITIENDKDNFSATIKLPTSFNGINWKPEGLHPIEVIDGQHRLWAFEGDKNAENFELPVVAFHGLDLSWQAYLFWSINITPRKIKPSLAYDLYPLLRSEEWLEKQDTYIVYRTARAQEIVEGLWSNESSPWYHRINMLGESGITGVSQSSFIQSLIATFFKSTAKGLGGLFIAPLKSSNELLDWTAAQQLAFLIFCWEKMMHAINKSKVEWANSLRDSKTKQYKGSDDPAFSSKFSLLSTDQGVRGFLYMVNDLVYMDDENLKLDDIFSTDNSSSRALANEAVNKASKEINSAKKINDFVDGLTEYLALFDWRTSGFEGLTFDQRSLKAGFRGSGGYKMLRLNLLNHLSDKKSPVSSVAKKVSALL